MFERFTASRKDHYYNWDGTISYFDDRQKIVYVVTERLYQKWLKAFYNRGR